jgi:hypothetical protein
MPDGTFKKQLALHFPVFDSATVNSRGDIYILSKSGLKLIECHDSNFNFKFYLLGFEWHLQFPHGKPIIFGDNTSNPNDYRYPNRLEIIKLIMKNDDLVVISNYSWRVLRLDTNHRVVNDFTIKEEEILKDFEIQLKKLGDKFRKKLKKPKKKPSKFEVFLSPFRAFIDKNENLCVIYEGLNRSSNIYQYRRDGMLKQKYKFPDKIQNRYVCAGGSGKIFVTRNKSTEIGIYKMNEL